MLNRSRMSAIALDFGACSLRGVQLRREDRSWCVHHWLNLETDPRSAEPEPLDYAARMQGSLGPGGFSQHKTRMLIGPPDVEYKMLELPPAVLNQSSEGLRTTLEYELEGQLPWQLEESELATWPIHPKAETRTNAMIVSAHRASIQRHLDVLDELKLECVSAEILPTATASLASSIPGQEGELPLWGVLDIGFRSCRLYLMHGARPVYARVVQGGGRQLTERLAEALHVDFHVAEQYKRIYGIQKTSRGFRSVVGGLSRLSEQALPGVLYAILRDKLEELCVDVERSCRFALGKVKGSVAGPILLVGGGARLKGLHEVLSDYLGIQVFLPDSDFFHASGIDLNNVRVEGDRGRAALAAMAPCLALALAEEET